MLKITEKKLTLAFGLTLILLAGNALISYRDLMEQARNTPMVVHSRRVLDQVAAVGSAVKGAESARRGYLIDGNPADRAEFEALARHILLGINALEAMTQTRPDQQPGIRELRQSALTCLGELQRSIDQVSPGGTRSPSELFEPGLIRRHLADCSRRIDSIQAAESQYLALRIEERRAGIYRAFVTFSVASTLALVTIGTTYSLVRRYLADRRQAERIMQESEARIRLLFDSVGEGIYGIDVHGCCTFCNPSALALLGFDSIDQVLGHDMHQLIHHTRPDGTPFPAHLCPIYHTFHSGQGVLGVEDFFYRADGRAVPVEYRAHAIQRDGKILGAVVTFVDIAPKRRAEVETRLRDRALRAIGQGVFIIDPLTPANPIVYANAAFERLTGYSRRDWVGRSIEILRGDDAAPEVEQLRRAVADRRETSVEILARRKDGSTFWNSLTLAPVEDPHGQVSHFVGVITDISERREHERTLKASEGRLRLMVESVRDYAIFSIDLDGNVSSWNAGAERLFGFTDREILGKPTTQFFTAEDQFAQIPAMELVRAEQTGRSDDERWQVRADGTLFLASGLVTPVCDESGKLLGFTKVARDITETKRVETELRAAKETAELAVQAKSTFLANMGHEFRTPLNAIIGYSEMLKDEAIDRRLEDFVPDLERIRDAGHSLLKLINNVLDLSRIEAGKTDLTVEPFDLGDLIRGVVRTIEPLAEQRGNVIQVEYPSDLGALHGDFEKVNQGLIHLLSNAVKFTESGTIIFRISRDDSTEQPWVVFTVIDDGIGMTRGELARLFQPFVQADGSPARKYGGTGLGLTIAYRFCQMMGGQIDVTSEPGRGSTFRMMLPARKVEATALSPAIS